MRKIQFTNEETYHVYNRGVDKRDTFITENDYYRFLESIRLFKNERGNTNNFLSRKKTFIDTSLKPYVEILAFCLMPNHFHLLLKQTSENGISKFMQKLGTGYTMFFNNKYERNGSLFEAPFKAKHVLNEEYFKHLSKYIHLNPLSLINLSSKKEEYVYLENYKWSSLYNYANNIQSFISLEILNLFKNPGDYLDYMYEAKPHQV